MGLVSRSHHLECNGANEIENGCLRRKLSHFKNVKHIKECAGAHFIFLTDRNGCERAASKRSRARTRARPDVR